MKDELGDKGKEIKRSSYASLPSNLNFKAKDIKSNISKIKDEVLASSNTQNTQSNEVNGNQKDKIVITKSKYIVNRFKQRALELAYKTVNKQRVAQNKKKQK